MDVIQIQKILAIFFPFEEITTIDTTIVNMVEVSKGKRMNVTGHNIFNPPYHQT
jgi:hypothetical protein